MPKPDYKSIKIPFLSNKIIAQKVELFRQKFWGQKVPVDIEKIVELRLKISIIPIPDLQNLCNTDAFLTSNGRVICVDNTSYLDERYSRRLRFSLAHKVGHFVLHRRLYEYFGIKNTADVYRFLEEIPQEQYKYLESQANKFANYLLAPRARLKWEKDRLLERIKRQVDLKKFDEKTVNSHLAGVLSKIFDVSDKVVEIALDDLAKDD